MQLVKNPLCLDTRDPLNQKSGQARNLSDGRGPGAHNARSGNAPPLYYYVRQVCKLRRKCGFGPPPHRGFGAPRGLGWQGKETKRDLDTLTLLVFCLKKGQTKPHAPQFRKRGLGGNPKLKMRGPEILDIAFNSNSPITKPCSRTRFSPIISSPRLSSSPLLSSPILSPAS